MHIWTSDDCSNSRIVCARCGLKFHSPGPIDADSSQDSYERLESIAPCETILADKLILDGRLSGDQVMEMVRLFWTKIPSAEIATIKGRIPSREEFERMKETIDKGSVAAQPIAKHSFGITSTIPIDEAKGGRSLFDNSGDAAKTIEPNPGEPPHVDKSVPHRIVVREWRIQFLRIFLDNMPAIGMTDEMRLRELRAANLFFCRPVVSEEALTKIMLGKELGLDEVGRIVG